jgi:hypothetical protein
VSEKGKRPAKPGEKAAKKNGPEERKRGYGEPPQPGERQNPEQRVERPPGKGSGI